MTKFEEYIERVKTDSYWRTEAFKYHHRNNPKYQGLSAEAARSEFDAEMNQPEAAHLLCATFITACQPNFTTSGQRAPSPSMTAPELQQTSRNSLMPLKEAIIMIAAGLVFWVGGRLGPPSTVSPLAVIVGKTVVVVGLGVFLWRRFVERRAR